MENNNKQILIIGSGTMGSGIAHTFAQNQFYVFLYDSNMHALDNAMHKISTNIERQILKGSISPSDKQTILERITPTTDIQSAAQNCILVIEAVPESLDIKQNVFKLVDELCPEGTILASNTSSISITQLASFTKRPDKVIGMHFMNPVPIMPLVEIISGLQTSKATTECIIKMSKAIGKTPVCTADFPGFISNRILMPMINEAIYAFQEGVAGIAEIDQIMKLGMAHPMGPLQLADYIGLDVCLHIMEVLHTGFGNTKYAPCPLLVKMVHAGFLGQKTKKGFYDWTDPKNLAINDIIR
jgi:3-hydroxybutyryl-CoA dehydrogenase